MLEKLERKCMRKLIALPDQKSLINYLMAIFDGERISARVKQFMCMIERFTTDYMLNMFLNKNQSSVMYERPQNKDDRSSIASQSVKGKKKKGQDAPPQKGKGIKVDRLASGENNSPFIQQEHRAIQGRREDHLSVKSSEENVAKFAAANQWYQQKQEEINRGQARRAQNLNNFNLFVREWQHQLALFFFDRLRDEDLEGYDEKENFYMTLFNKKGAPSVAREPKQDAAVDAQRAQNIENKERLPNAKVCRRQDIMENFRMRVLRNLDLAVELVLDEGIVILKKYEDLDFYLKKMAGGKIYDFKAMQKIKQIRKQTPATNTLGKTNKN